MPEGNIEPGFKRKITALYRINEAHFTTLKINVQGYKTGGQLATTQVLIYTGFTFVHQAFR